MVSPDMPAPTTTTSHFKLSACGPSEGPQPAHLLSKTQMATILADIHLAESYADNTFPSRDTARMAFNILQKKIFAKHNVADTVFRDSYDYYLYHLQDMDQIYEAVIDTLNLRELKVRAEEGVDAPNPPHSRPPLDVKPSLQL